MGSNHGYVTNDESYYERRLRMRNETRLTRSYDLLMLSQGGNRYVNCAFSLCSTREEKMSFGGEFGMLKKVFHGLARLSTAKASKGFQMLSRLHSYPTME